MNHKITGLKQLKNNGFKSLCLLIHFLTNYRKLTKKNFFLNNTQSNLRTKIAIYH